jgi:hypothetical protein
MLLGGDTNGWVSSQRAVTYAAGRGRVATDQFPLCRSLNFS